MQWTSWLASMAAFTILGCSSSTGPSGGGNTPPPNASVSVENNFFDPSSINITPGQTVRWTWNSGGTKHNVTFDTGSSSPTQGSGTFDRTFATAGTFNYHCTIHGQAMSGSVVVTQSSTQTGGTGYGGGGGGTMPGY